MADAARALAMDAVAVACSGQAELPIGMADAATALWTRVLRFDAADPRWPDRDRFVMSAGQGAALLYALLALTDHAGMGTEQLRQYRRLHSPAAGHPEHGLHPAIEATTGPLGQGLGCAVGLALAERLMAARFGKSLVDHRTWVLAGDGDLMEGLSHEAASLAGHLRLAKLTVLWEQAEGDDGADLACSDDQLRRFAALGWAVKAVDGHDPAALASALSLAVRSKKPMLIACRTGAGATVPTDADANRAALGWEEPSFAVPPDLLARWNAAGHRGASDRRGWLKRMQRHPLRAEFERAVAGRLPETWTEALAALRTELAETRPTLATRQASDRALDVLLPVVPDLVGGSADAADGCASRPRGLSVVTPGAFAGRHINYGVREHAMAACMNGLALHGGLLPYASAFLTFSDYMRPAIRLAALMRQKVVHVLSHDSIGVGEGGATVQPVEHLAGLRAMPGVNVLRPADAVETVECWELALRRTDGPTLLVLSTQALPALRTDAGENRCARGGYVLAEAEGARRATLIATGSEVASAMDARALLAADGIPVAVVSLPCWALFAAADEAAREAVLGTAPRFGIEAACGFGWERWLGTDGPRHGGFIGMTGYGASAPAEDLYRHFGLTPEAIATAVRKRLAQLDTQGDKQ